jgi:dihydrofolate reductase
MPEIRLIAAVDEQLGIARDGQLPWDLPTDRKYFRDHIAPGPVVMGWNTFSANDHKPYGIGTNTVITHRDTEAVPGVWIVHDVQEFFERNSQDVWVVGGGQIFAQVLPYATQLYITRIRGTYDCDVFFPEFEKDFVLEAKEPWQEENGVSYRYEIWRRSV